MKKRDKQRERREVIHALSMILQIGLAMLTCMGISLAIGYYLDQLLGTKIWVIIMLVIGILASMRSLLVLTGQYGNNGSKKEETPQTPEKPSRPSDSPKTGDNTNLYGLLALLLTSGAGLAGIFFYKRRKMKKS